MEGIFLAWLAGVMAQLCQAELWDSAVYVAVFCVAALGLVGRQFFRAARIGAVKGNSAAAGLTVWQAGCRWLMVWGLTACMGFAWAGWRGCERQAYTFLDAQLQRRDVVVTGYVDSLPQLQPGRWRFVFNVERAQLDGVSVDLPQKVMLSWYFSTKTQGHVPEIEVGQKWTFEVRLRAPHGYMNPNGFDYELWLWEQGIGAVGYVRTAQQARPPELLAGAQDYYSMARLRGWVRAQITHTVSDASVAGVLSALTLGDQRAITRADWDTFRATGVAHLVSISGLHITMMAWLAYGLAGWGWRRSERLMLWVPAHMAALAAGLVCAVFYAWFAGWGIPAQRTVLMLAVVVVLRFLGGRWPWYSVWLLVAVVVVTVDPWALLQAGFWLSFVAVGVLLAQSHIEHGRSKGRVDGPKPLAVEVSWWQRMACSVFSALWQMMQVQLRISVVLAPLTLLLFHQVSVVGLLANLLAIPWVTFVMVPLSLLGVFIHGLWHLAAWSARMLLYVLQWCAQWQWAVWEGAQPPLVMAVVAVAGAVVLVLPCWRWRYRLLGVLPVFVVLIWQPSKPEAGQFDVWVLDVGQGGAVLVRTATHALLYDTGPRYSADLDAGAFVVVPALRAAGVQLDRVVVSHADQDHAGGTASVLAAYPKADLVWSVPQAVLPVGVDAVPCVEGLSWQWDGVVFTVLHPAGTGNWAGVSSNAQSCVLHVSSSPQGGAGSRAVLLTGDIEASQEQTLVMYYGERANGDAGLLRADLLLMPHHGSKSSSSAGFLDAVRPQWGIAQAGYLNRFEHPAAEVFSAIGKGVFRSQIRPVAGPYCGAALIPGWFDVSVMHAGVTGTGEAGCIQSKRLPTLKLAGVKRRQSGFVRCYRAAALRALVRELFPGAWRLPELSVRRDVAERVPVLVLLRVRPAVLKPALLPRGDSDGSRRLRVSDAVLVLVVWRSVRSRRSLRSEPKRSLSGRASRLLRGVPGPEKRISGLLCAFLSEREPLGSAAFSVRRRLFLWPFLAPALSVVRERVERGWLNCWRAALTMPAVAWRLGALPMPPHSTWRPMTIGWAFSFSPGAKPSIVICSTGRRMSFSICCIKPASSTVTRLMATPSDPARPVRPMRCT